MAGAFDGEDFISFEAEPPASSGRGSSRGKGKASQTGTAATVRNRIAEMLAAATARRAAEKQAQKRQQQQQAASGSASSGKGKERASSSASAGPSRAQGTKRKHHEIVAEENRLSKKERQELFAASTPWSVDVDWDRCENGAEMLHREIMAFDAWLMPTTAEIECRDMVIALIRKAIQSKWADADVRPFGSHNTRLYLPEGDIDLVVLSNSMSTQPREVVLRNMAYILRTNNLASGNVQVIAKAKVPIIKFVCSYGEYKVDISVNQSNGLTAAEFVLDNLEQQPALRPIIMVIKQLLSSRSLSEVYTGGLGSYSVILSAISFMQMHPRIQRSEIDPAQNLGVLLLEYLELYGKRFAHDELGISVRGKGSYFKKAIRGFLDHRSTALKMCLEDPLDPTNDVASGSYGFSQVRSTWAGAFDMITSAIGERSTQLGGPKGSRPTADQIRAAAKERGNSRYSDEEDEWARQMLMQETNQAGAKDPMSLLGKLFGIKPSTIKHRKKIKRLWESNELQIKLGRPTARITPEPGPSSSRPQSGVEESTADVANGSAEPNRNDVLRNKLPSLNRAVVTSIRAGVRPGEQKQAKAAPAPRTAPPARAKPNGTTVTIEKQLPQLADDGSKSDGDDDEEESRYATSKRQRVAAAGPLLTSGSAPAGGSMGRDVESAYVLDDSASSGAESVDQAYAAAADAMYAGSGDDDDVEDEDDEPARKRQRNGAGASTSATSSSSPAKKRATRREVDDYWASKGNSLSVPGDGEHAAASAAVQSDDDDIVFVGASQN